MKTKQILLQIKSDLSESSFVFVSVSLISSNQLCSQTFALITQCSDNFHVVVIILLRSLVISIVLPANRGPQQRSGERHFKTTATENCCSCITPCIYTIILLKSVGVRKWQVAILARSYRLTVHPVTRSRLSSA